MEAEDARTHRRTPRTAWNATANQSRPACAGVEVDYRLTSLSPGLATHDFARRPHRTPYVDLCDPPKVRRTPARRRTKCPATRPRSDGVVRGVGVPSHLPITRARACARGGGSRSAPAASGRSGSSDSGCRRAEKARAASRASSALGLRRWLDFDPRGGDGRS